MSGLRVRTRIFLSIVCLVVGFGAWQIRHSGVAAAHPAAKDVPLRVVIKELVPFVIIEEELTGFSIELWEAIAARMEIDYEFVIVETVTEQLDAVQQGEADLGIAGISITQEREEVLDFSHSFFDAGLQIMTLDQSNTPGVHMMSVVVSPAFFEIVGLFLVAILVAAHFIWFAERRSNPDFPLRYWPGIWEAFWWSSVTVTTVGYGDKTPRGQMGRAVGLIWMFASLFLVAHFTAGVTTAMTLEGLNTSIQGVHDLAGKRTVTIVGSTGDQYLNKIQIHHTTVPRIEDAYELLAQERIDAIVYDSPVLNYYAATTGQGTVRLVGAPFHEEQYGIALSADSPLRESINQALLELREDGTYDQLYAKWFGHIP